MSAHHGVLANRYEILDFLGEGGMARVFRGRDRVLERTVAIKLLSGTLATDPASVERFRREARSAAGLSHPGIVNVYDTGTEGDLHYIVMEYVEGKTLDRVLQDEGRLAPDRALEIAERVCEALAAAHAHALIHRDVKPGNIMLAADGAVKVMDFGIARAVESDTASQTAAILGTASYLSPEQARGDPVDARSDLYSLGVVLYEMLVGKPPFEGENPLAIATKHVHDAPLPPSYLVPGLIPGHDGVVLRALEKSPDRRYGSAQEFAADLRNLREGATDLLPAVPAAQAEATQVLPADHTQPITPAPATAPGPSAAVRRRFPVAAALAAFLVLAIVFALVLVGLSNSPDTGPGGQGASGAVPTTSRPAPTTSPPASTEPPPEQSLSVTEAAAALATEVAQGVRAGEVSQKAGDQILRGEGKALRDFQRGDADKAIEDLSELNDTVDELAEKGEISSEDREAAIHSAIDDLVGAIEAA